MNTTRIYFNGPILTVDQQDHVVQALVTKGRYITYVGSVQGAREHAGSNAQCINLMGQTLIPGFIDSHLHLGQIGMGGISADCRRATCVADVVELIREQARNTPKGQWVRGWGLNEMKLAEKRMPTCQELDQATTDHPVMITRACFHVSVNNSLALQLGNIHDDTPSPPGGLIEKKSGHVTGTLKEVAHNNLLKIAMPDENTLEKAMADASRGLVQQGITSVHVAGCYGYPQMRAMQKGVRNGTIKTRIYAVLFTFIDCEQFLEDYIKCGIVTGFGDERFRIGPVKLMIDGSTSAPTAAMFAPYDSRPGDCGILCYTPEQVEEMMIKANRAGYQCTVHAVGDRAVDVMVTAIEKALQDTPRENHRHRIEHCGFINPDLVARIKKLGIVVVPQTAFFYDYGDGYVVNYGQRIHSMFPCRTWFDNGVVAAGSSDCPVASSDPIFGMYEAVNRITNSGQRISQDQRITIPEALRMYTYNGAYASLEEHLKGSLEAGKLADMVVLSQNPYETEPEKLRQIQVQRTIIDGEDVYIRSQQAKN